MRLLYNLLDTKTFHLKGVPHVPLQQLSLHLFKETFVIFSDKAQAQR